MSTERPILFSAPMVRALLDGTKTQTRRVLKGVKHFPEWGSAAGMVGGAWLYGSPAGLGLSDRGDHWSVTLDEDHIRRMCTREAYGWGAGAGCPYGQPGDRLFVKETWRTAKSLDGKSPNAIGEMCIDAGYRKPWAPLAYEADGHRNSEWHGFEMGCDAEPGKTRVSIHMPRWASRITLEITQVRVERLQDISEMDCVAEGIRISSQARRSDACYGIYECLMPDGKTHFNDSAYALYRALWEAINGAGSWDANTWVWVVEFKVVKP